MLYWFLQNRVQGLNSEPEVFEGHDQASRPHLDGGSSRRCGRTVPCLAHHALRHGLLGCQSKREARLPSSSSAQAGDALATQIDGSAGLIKPFPGMTPEDWDQLNQILSERSNETLRSYKGVLGGYYISDGRRFLGSAGPAVARRKLDAENDVDPSAGPPPAEFDVIETQVDAAIRKRKVIYIIQAQPPSVAAIRAAPITRDGQILGAVWTMTRLVDPLFLDRSIRGYGWAAGLALGGMTLALGLTIGLAGRLSQEVAIRNRLQTELRRSERLAALGKLVAGVAHEVRNPLAGIRGITQLWKRGLGFGAEAFDHLTDEVDRLEGIVARLLQFSKSDAQDLLPGDINAVVVESARLIEAAAKDKGVRLDLEIDDRIPPIPISPPALLQVLRNLGMNAVQVMPQGGKISLKTHLDAGRNLVSVSLADTGPGLAPETMEHLFEPFFTTKPEGTGLGLAIAREIAIAHRGDLSGFNREIGGAEFRLTLPCDGAPSSNGAAEQ